MKQVTLLFFLFVSQLAFAQRDSSNLFTDISEAETFAKDQNVSILMVFAGSDWCKPCMQFKKEILSNDSFQAYAKNNLAILPPALLFSLYEQIASKSKWPSVMYG